MPKDPKNPECPNKMCISLFYSVFLVTHCFRIARNDFKMFKNRYSVLFSAKMMSQMTHTFEYIKVIL